MTQIKRKALEQGWVTFGLQAKQEAPCWEFFLIWREEIKNYI